MNNWRPNNHAVIAGNDYAGQYSEASVNPDGLLANRNYVWDTGSLSWVAETQPTGGGGGGVTWTFKDATFRKKFMEAVTNVIEGVKEESAKVI